MTVHLGNAFCCRRHGTDCLESAVRRVIVTKRHKQETVLAVGDAQRLVCCFLHSTEYYEWIS